VCDTAAQFVNEKYKTAENYNTTEKTKKEKYIGSQVMVTAGATQVFLILKNGESITQNSSTAKAIYNALALSVETK